MRDITDEYKKNLSLLRTLTRIQAKIQKESNSLEDIKKESWVCPDCKHRFVKPFYLDKNNSDNYFKIPTDESIILKDRCVKSFSKWTTAGFDYYDADVASVYVKCPHCKKESFQYTQRLNEGKYTGSKDSW